MHVTTLQLSRSHPSASREARDLCAMHSRVIDATAGMAETGPRTLWAQPTPDTLVIRAVEPVTTARLPAGYATSVTHRPWVTPDTPGIYHVVAVVNPGRHSNLGGPTLNQPERRRENIGPKLLSGLDEQRAWLLRRLNATTTGAATIDDFAVTRTWVATGDHRTDRKITVRSVAVAMTVTVTIPDGVMASIVGGIGIDKTWGCGLTLWRRAC